MSWWSVLLRPAPLVSDETAVKWFPELADQLLNRCRLVVAGTAHRLTEVEVYYHGEGHREPFSHREPIQRQSGPWYFHRSHGSYRSGSFKGLDLSFGDDTAFGGILIRGLEKPDGTLIDGPSLCVDYLLHAVGASSVADLDRAIGKRLAWQADNPLYLQAAEIEQRPVYRSPRIGLTLKRGADSIERRRFVLRDYRFLTQPARISKGRVLLVLALHAQGVAPEEIQRLTGCSRSTIDRYIAGFESGQREGDFNRYGGRNLTTLELAGLYGVWHARNRPALIPLTSKV